jgi:hypothetical protein
VEGVEFFQFDSAPYHFNFDTEAMEELGYNAFFVPGGGIVVNTPDTPPAVAAGRIIADLEASFGRLQIGDELEAEDVRWGSWSPRREAFTVQAIRAEDDGMLAVTVHEVHGFERTLSVLPDRRFLKAADG